MTEDERAFCEEVRRAALDIIGYTGLIEQDAEPGSRQAQRARKASVALVALAATAAKRVTDADMRTEQAAVEASGYDLGALASAPPSRIKEPSCADGRTRSVASIGALNMGGAGGTTNQPHVSGRLNG